MFLGKIYKPNERDFAVSSMTGAPSDTKATLRIRLLTPGERREVMTSGFGTVYALDGNGGATPEMKMDNYKPSETLFSKAVVGWDGFFEDAEGAVPLKYGSAGKKMLLSVLPELADFAMDCHKILIEEESERKQKETENL